MTSCGKSSLTILSIIPTRQMPLKIRMRRFFVSAFTPALYPMTFSVRSPWTIPWHLLTPSTKQARIARFAFSAAKAQIRPKKAAWPSRDIKELPKTDSSPSAFPGCISFGPGISIRSLRARNPTCFTQYPVLYTPCCAGSIPMSESPPRTWLLPWSMPAFTEPVNTRTRSWKTETFDPWRLKPNKSSFPITLEAARLIIPPSQIIMLKWVKWGQTLNCELSSEIHNSQFKV